jgi:nucleotide-binding universal stress UspA family protein
LAAGALRTGNFPRLRRKYPAPAAAPVAVCGRTRGFRGIRRRHEACPRFAGGYNVINLKRILVPHDFSDSSEAAVRYAIELARKFGARLYFLNVSERLRMEMGTDFPVGLEEAVEAAVRERLMTIVTPQERNELKPLFIVVPGAPAAAIVRYASDEHIDLIVMGTHGRGFVAHVVLGSVAEKVVRTAPCPVLTVRNRQHQFVGVDETAAAGQAVATPTKAVVLF